MIKLLKQRYLDFLMNNPVEMITDFPLDSVENIVQELDKEGRFIDIVYGDDSELNDFAADHCVKLQNIAWQYRKTKDAKLLVELNKGLKWWTDHNYRGNNWYINLVTVPRVLSQILLLVGDVIEPSIECELSKRVKNSFDDPRHKYDIGGNTMMLGTNVYIYSIYKEDEVMLETCKQRMSEEMNFADHHLDNDLKWRGEHWKSYVKVEFDKEIYEGIQQDYTFFEHGPMLYTGGYGNIYFTHIASLIYMTRGTGFFPEKCINFVVDFLLDHLRWAMYNNGYDYNVSGRNIVNENDESHMPNPVLMASRTADKTIVQLALAVSNYRKEEMKELCSRLELVSVNNERNRSSVSGNRFFPIGLYMAHHNAKFFTSVRMTSDLVIGSECVNWENISGWHQGDGVQYIQVNGDEYKGIFPAWNWKKLPGVTSVHNPMKPLDYAQSIHFKASHSKYCGGISNGQVGASAMWLKREHMSAKKAWFMFEEECVCLGTDITTDLDYEVTTTINQTLLKGEVLTDCEAGNQWFYHNNVGYIIHGNQKFHISAEKQSGNRHDVIRSHKPIKPEIPDMVTKEVFTLWINHGVKAMNESYSYSIVPGILAGKPMSRATILMNNSKVQAVECKKIVQIVFWEKTELVLEDSIIKADGPCVVILEHGDLTVTELKRGVKDTSVVITKVKE